MKTDTFSKSQKQGIQGRLLNFPPSAWLIWKQALNDFVLS